MAFEEEVAMTDETRRAQKLSVGNESELLSISYSELYRSEAELTPRNKVIRGRREEQQRHFGDLCDYGRLDENRRRERVHCAILPFAEVRYPYIECPSDWTT